MTDRLRLSGLRFYGNHGVLPEERERGQIFEVDVDMGCDMRGAARSDDLADTVDAREAFRRVQEVVEGEQVDLVETLADRVADRLLDLPPVHDVLVRVRKPEADVFVGYERGYEVEIRRGIGFGPEASVERNAGSGSEAR